MDSIKFTSSSVKGIDLQKPAQPEIKQEQQTDTKQEEPQINCLQLKLKITEAEHQINQIQQKIIEERAKSPDANVDIYLQQVTKLFEFKMGLQQQLEKRISNTFN